MMRIARITTISLICGLFLSSAAFGQDAVPAAEAEAEAAPKAAAPEPKAASLSELLEQVKSGWRKENSENSKREARFVASKKDQASLLRKAKDTLAGEERRSEQLENDFGDNEENLAQLEEKLQQALGTLGEVFGVVRQVSGDTRSNLEGSLISAEYPDRTPFLDALGQNTALPSIEDLEKLWFTLHQEMTESGRVTRFDTDIVDVNGTQRTASVVRVGPFIATADGEYLKWDEQIGRLQKLPRQPAGRFLSTLRDLQVAESGLVRVAIDPARGTLLAALVQSRTSRERIEDGGEIGYVIILMGSVTFVLALVRLVYVFIVSRKVKSQLGNSTPSDGNPLGRVISVYDENREVDSETLELKLDEAILRETSHIERYLWLVKVIAAIAPLMGLLGTVTGMIQVFQTITLFGAGDPKLMADGISVALVTTMLGLIVAIPLVLLHSVISSMAKVITDVLEEQSAGLVATRSEGDIEA